MRSSRRSYTVTIASRIGGRFELAWKWATPLGSGTSGRVLVETQGARDPDYALPGEAGAFSATLSRQNVPVGRTAIYTRAVTDSTGGNDLLQGIVIGAVCLGLLGALVGLIRGLWVYPPTALFAVYEAGVPALMVGGLLGAFVGSAARLIGRSHHSGKSHS
jgi:hypothetical protein